MWVVKVGHMLREKENERGGDRRERVREADRNMETWVGERGRDAQRKGERAREGGGRIPSFRRSGSVTGLFPFI